MKSKLTLALLVIGFSSSAFSQTIVYQDTFDEDGLDVNTGIGGGGISENFNVNSDPTPFLWNDDDDGDEGLSTGFPAGSGSQITTFRSENSFNVTNGFTLEVVFDIASNVAGSPFPSNHLSFGLASEDSDGASNLLESNGFTPVADAIGFSLGTRNGSVDEGLLEWDADANAPDEGLTSTLDGFIFELGSAQTITLEVDGNGNFTYTYGGITGTGTTAIDLNETYFFRARTQGSRDNVIQSVTLTTTSAQFEAPIVTTSASVFDLAVPIDVNVTFDPSANVAELVTSNGTENLLTLDTDGDGQVVFSDTPPIGDFTFEVSTSRADIAAPLEAETTVTIIDPADEAPSNAFSTAIIADSPLFYYRYEELADSTFIRDSSGNDFHTNDFTENLILGGGPGGIQNAIFYGSSANPSARGILVPASSEMSESFSFVSVIQVSDFIFDNSRNILSMQNGTGLGATILGRRATMNTLLDGANTILTDENVLPPNTTCLVHCIFTADDVNGGGEMAIYIDGELYDSAIIDPFDANTGNWVIGATPIVGDPSWRDWLDETAIYESALTQAQITAHADAFLEAADDFLGFYADTEEIELGGSVVLNWKVANSVFATIEAAPEGGNPTILDANSGTSFTFSPPVTTTYTILINGVRQDEEAIVVTVSSPIEPAVIQSFTYTLSNNSPIVILEISGEPNTTYSILASQDLIFDENDLNLGLITLDENGELTQEFSADPNIPREFYQAVTN